MVRIRRGLGEVQSRDGGETQRGSETSRPCSPSVREPGFPGHFPFSTCFSLLIIFLFKYYDVGETTELPLSVVRKEAIRRDAGFQEIPDLTAPYGHVRVFPSFPRVCASGGWEGLCEVIGVHFVVLPKLSSLQLSLSQLAASPQSPAQRRSAEAPSKPPGSPTPSLAPGVSSLPLLPPASFQGMAPNS